MDFFLGKMPSLTIWPRELFRATSTKGVAASPKFLYDIFVQETKKLKTIEALFSFVYQPITVGALRAARALGGDPLDLDPADGPILSMSQFF